MKKFGTLDCPHCGGSGHIGDVQAAVEPVAWKHDCAALLANDVELWIDACPHCGKPRMHATQAAHPSPPEGMVGGWISVDKRLPEPNVGVLCAGQGWGNPFVTACYYDDERREWYPINTHWNDSPGSAQYPTHWMPLPPPPTSSADSRKGE